MLTQAKMLKIKIKSLVAERKIINHELLAKANGRLRTKNQMIRSALYTHGERELAEETRLTLVAYGYVRGRR